ncbi:Protein of unknown function [Cotesia congregata]|uniref:Endonuclease/exonuclease/phosphatase domain-containing protein n=1 Tax=Cotesia congregata TaxID=51543 RepID=A0A8J2MWC8_COTCN|nr:Protein of unknown function [Cotesia congregata]
MTLRMLLYPSQDPSLIGNSTIIAACETWITKPYSPTFLVNYNIYWSNAIRNHSVGRASGGLITAINANYRSFLVEDSPWWIFNKVIIGSTVLILGSLYLRKCLDLRFLLDMLQEVLDGIKSTHTDDTFIIGGDLNARVGSLSPWPEELFSGLPLNSSVTTTDELICDRGRLLMDFMLENDFVLLNGRTAGDSPAQPTYDNLGTSIINLVWTDISSLHLIVDLEVVLEPSLSDHRPVRLTIQTEDFEHRDDSFSQSSPSKTKKIIWSEESKQSYQNNLLSFQNLPNITADSTDTIYNWLIGTIHSAAEKAGFIKTSCSTDRQKAPRNPWFDKTCKEAKKNFRKALRNCKKEQFSINARQEVANSKSIYKNLCQEKKKAHMQIIKNAFANASEPTNFWAAVKKFSFRRGAQCEIPANKWNAFYATIYKPRMIMNRDISASRSSSSLEFPLSRPDQYSPAKYLLLKLPLSTKCILVQLRLANKYNCYLTLKKHSIKFSPNNQCPLGNMQEEDNLRHFLCTCPMFSAIRQSLIQEPLQKSGSINKLLTSSTPKELYAIVNNVETTMKLRAWALNL